MHHLQKSYLDWNAFARRAYLYKESGLCLINRKVLRTNLGVHPSPPHHAGGPPIFVDWSFEHQFNLSSRIKSVLLMWEARTLWWAIITDKTKNWKFANRCGLLLHNCNNNNNKMGLCVPFSGIKVKNFDLSTLVYIRLVARLNSSTLV